MATTEVAAPSGSSSVTQSKRHDYDPASVALIRHTVAVGVPDALLGQFLELSARYELDPFAKEIWCVKNPGKNGKADSILIIVAAAGWLKIANRQPDFVGCPSDVVRKNDEYSTERIEDPSDPLFGEIKVTHKVLHADVKERGPIVGAWAKCYREGHKATFFFAPMSEYQPKSEMKLKYSPWGSQESAMILKCAEAMALRKQFSISGLYAEGELSRQIEQPVDQALTESDGVPLDLPKELVERTRAVLQEARDCGLDPFRPAKVRALMVALDEDGVAEFLNDLEHQIADQLAVKDAQVVEGVATEVSADEGLDVLPDAPGPVLAEDDVSPEVSPELDPDVAPEEPGV